MQDKKLTVEHLHQSAEDCGGDSNVFPPLDSDDKRLLKDGFSLGRMYGNSCMKWIWYQWLLGGSCEAIRRCADSFVSLAMEMQEASPKLYMRPIHDLYLLHCAIFGASEHHLPIVARAVVDASGPKGRGFPDDGDRYAAAWCGMLKHWILGDAEEAARQAQRIWGAYRHPSFAAATKPLVEPWLKGDWDAFAKAQQKDFDKLWARGRKNGTVRSVTKREVVVTVKSYPIQQAWCWAHCGLALLAHRRGVPVATDAFWFPPHALKCVEHSVSAAAEPARRAGARTSPAQLPSPESRRSLADNPEADGPMRMIVVTERDGRKVEEIVTIKGTETPRRRRRLRR